MKMHELAARLAAWAKEHRTIDAPAQQKMADLQDELSELLTLYLDAVKFCSTDTAERLEAKFKKDAFAIVTKIEDLQKSANFQKSLKYFVASGMTDTGMTAKEIADRFATWGIQIDPTNITRYQKKDPS